MHTSKHITHPCHLYIDDAPYFITAATYQHQKLLDDELKSQLEKIIQKTFKEYGWKLDAWVILDNHYHLLCQSKHGKDLTRIMAKVHNLSAQLIKAKTGVTTKIWSNYWDYCPRNAEEYTTRLCYLLNNPYKHGYVDDLKDWQWSSFHQYYQEKGKQHLKKQFQQHADYKTLQLEEDQGDG